MMNVRGKVVMLVGPTGVGKTTLVELLHARLGPSMLIKTPSAIGEKLRISLSAGSQGVSLIAVDEISCWEVQSCKQSIKYLCDRFVAVGGTLLVLAQNICDVDDIGFPFGSIQPTVINVGNSREHAKVQLFDVCGSGSSKAAERERAHQTSRGKSIGGS